MSLYRSERHFGLAMRHRPDTQPSIFWLPCRDGPCENGKKLCPSPQACRQPEVEAKPSKHNNWAPWLVVAFVIAAGLFAAFYPAVK